MIAEPESITAPARPVTRRFLFIDGLRGIAACCVMVFHFIASGSFGPIFQHRLPAVFAVARFGYLGVDIFFVLSGFVIAFSVRNEQVTGRFFRNFIVRRCLRLDPPYLVTIGLTLLLLWFYNSGLHQHFTPMPTFKETLANMFYLTGILKIEPMLPVFWTLCLEVQFYLLFVSALWIGRLMSPRGHSWTKSLLRVSASLRFKSFGLQRSYSCPEKNPTDPLGSQLNWISLLLLALLGAASIAVTGGWLPRFEGWFINDWNLFLLGSILWWTIDRKLSPAWLIAYAGLLTFASVRTQSYAGFTGLMTMSAITITALTGTLTTALSNRPLQFLGRISYSLYLLHPLIGPQIDGYITWHHRDSLMASISCVGVSIGVSIAAAWMMYQYVEVLGIRLGRRFRFTV